MADELELQRFRDQWKQEVTARTRGRGRPASSSAAPGPSSPRSPSALHKARPSFSHTRPALDVDENTDFVQDLPSSSRQPTTSPPPPRRSSFSTTGIPKSALEHYEKAVEKETEGSLGESLKLYRKAFRMDDAVDTLYKDKHFPRSDAKGKALAASPAAATGNSVATAPLGISDLVSSFAGLGIEPTTKPSLSPGEEVEDVEAREKKFSLLAAVPSELLLQILRCVALDDIASFVRLSQVCKSLCYIVATEERIWRHVCKRSFSRQVWDWKVSVTGRPLIDERLGSGAVLEEDLEDDNELDDDDDDERRVVPVDEAELLRYKDSWREMFHFRPRLRYNGIYISTCNYHRQGGHSGTSLSWGTPVHIVTYYRYLRFYPDGTLLSLLTTHEPAEVVYAFSKPALTPAHLGGLSATSGGGGGGGPSAVQSWAEHVSRGRWRIDVDGRLDIETEAPKLPRYLFRMQLRIKNVKGARMTKGGVKLVWEGFWSWNKMTDDLAVFEGRNDKPFFFSRVAAVEKEGVV